ncbi:Cna B-type domain-containing protein [Butyrivibrio sp. JL13D10]|uniref:Cna B-type domain-containing protein n=1 Tax=Butyrivibrio sp. JL13D10 TaxID=3236815 RepID=UPI0038B46051
MKIFKKMKKLIIGGTLAALTLAMMIPTAVSAGSEDSKSLGKIDMSRDTTLSVYYSFDASGEIPAYGKMSGVNVKVYKMASISEDGTFTLIAPFDQLDEEITDMYSISDQDKWNGIITKAVIIANENSVQPSYIGTSDSEGYARLGKVDKGLYLGINDPIVIDDIQYKYWDFLSVVPGPNNLEENQGNGWDGTWTNAYYDVIAIPKKEAVKLEGDPEEYQVFKQWVDDGAANRPLSIDVKIYCDGTLLETVTLSNDNNWQYKWKSEKGHIFTVEEVMNTDDYTSKISRNENTFVIVNTKEPDEPDKPDKPEKPKKPDKPNKPNNPGSPDEPDTPNNDTPDDGGVLGAIRRLSDELPEVLGARRLPQTGQLWWPIPILAIVGIILIFLGFRSERKRK